jgi:hypothetical protein
MWYVLGRGEVHTGLCWGHLSEGDYWEDPSVDGKIILKWGRMDWIYLAQEMEKWWAVVSTEMNPGFP